MEFGGKNRGHQSSNPQSNTFRTVGGGVLGKRFRNKKQRSRGVCSQQGGEPNEVRRTRRIRREGGAQAAEPRIVEKGSMEPSRVVLVFSEDYEGEKEEVRSTAPV